jgi:hypothetical protein
MRRRVLKKPWQQQLESITEKQGEFHNFSFDDSNDVIYTATTEIMASGDG